jgi:pre-mRNA cleavage complex 2 protein Pcf11
MDEEEEEIDEEQVEDYCAMLDRLGNFPEKVAINSLSMAAEDFAASRSSALTIYGCVLSRLVDRTSPGISSPDRKLPLVYVLDSLLKNVKGVFIDIIQDDAANWMSTVYDIFDKAKKEDEKARLKKVWNTWREFGVIKDAEKWREIGKCFLRADEKAKAAADARTAAAASAGIARNADGTLLIPPSLRRQMQLLLDEVQSAGVDELDKVSLERLADINPDLLQQIKEASMEEQKQQQQNSMMLSSTSGPSTVLASPVPPLSDWSRLNLNHLEKTHDLIASLQRHVRSANEMTVVATHLDDTVHLYASVSASAQILTDMLQRLKDGKGLGFFAGEGDDRGNSRRRRYSLVRKENFTTDGVKKRNDAVISQLYEVGLPFVCSADGRRFTTQLELSRHLDALFRSSQLEKTMDRTEERGWYPDDDAWSSGGDAAGAASSSSSPSGGAEKSPSNAPGGGAAGVASAGGRTAESTTVVADEARDRCVLCGINFAMFFDQDDGEWKYRNCKEMDVEDDGPTMDDEELEPVLVHFTCWEGLGSPGFLTPDQIRHAT